MVLLVGGLGMKDTADAFVDVFFDQAINYQTRLNLDPAQFVPGVDVAMMYREMYWASEGYLWEKVQQGGAMDIDQMEKDFMELLKFWKSVYLRKE